VLTVGSSSTTRAADLKAFLNHEAAKADRAITAFAALAERRDALAAERWPWLPRARGVPAGIWAVTAVMRAVLARGRRIAAQRVLRRGDGARPRRLRAVTQRRSKLHSASFAHRRSKPSVISITARSAGMCP
jgi:hypothetical protein